MLASLWGWPSRDREAELRAALLQGSPVGAGLCFSAAVLILLRPRQTQGGHPVPPAGAPAPPVLAWLLTFSPSLPGVPPAARRPLQLLTQSCDSPTQFSHFPP